MTKKIEVQLLLQRLKELEAENVRLRTQVDELTNELAYYESDDSDEPEPPVGIDHLPAEVQERLKQEPELMKLVEAGHLRYTYDEQPQGEKLITNWKEMTDWLEEECRTCFLCGEDQQPGKCRCCHNCETVNAPDCDCFLNN